MENCLVLQGRHKRMKTTRKPYSILKYSIIVLTTIIFIGIAGFFTFGFNKGVEFGNSYQIEAVYFFDEEYVEVETACHDVLSEHGFSIREKKVFKNGYFSTAVFTVKADSIENVEEIRGEIIFAIFSEKSYENPESLVSIQKIGRSVPSSYGWLTFAVIATITAICFVLGWIFFGIFGGLSLSLGFLYTILISLALVLFTRVELSSATLATVLILSLGIASALALVFQKFGEFSKEKEFASSSRKIFFEISKIGKSISVVAIASILFISLILFLTFKLDYIFVATTILITTFSGIVSTLFFALPLRSLFFEKLKK